MAANDAPHSLSFNRDIRPILSENCYACHGFDPTSRKGKRRLDTFEGATADRNGVRAVVPGEPEESDLWLRVSSPYEDEVMPPLDSHKKLTAAQKEKLRIWISEGAVYEPHWAFVPPPAVVPIPAVKDQGWPRGDLDHFVLARLEADDLVPAPEASPERWLRRATFDLTGLPPTQPEIDSFLADRSPGAYLRVVNRLLGSPRFGEHMATPWLDIARYADSYGYQSDVDTKAWPYRDWVIRALNANLPWDQFVLWQIAGDLLPNATRDQRLATAFNRLHRKTNEGGSDPEEFRQDGISDRVHTFGTAFLGLTLECAQCHDHRFDPISTRDYYSLGAFFNSIDEYGVLLSGKKRAVAYPAMDLPTAEQERMIAAQREEADRQKRLVREWPAAHESDFQRWLAAPHMPEEPADLVAHFPLDGDLTNRVPQTRTDATAVGAGNTFITGRTGEALLCSGDDPVKLPGFGIAHAHDPMSFAFWLRPGERSPRALVLSNGASADATYNGYELLIEDGRLRWSVIREYPGNCASLITSESIPVGEWTHVVVTYDGSSRASGLAIYLNGRLSSAKIVRDNLTRDYLVGKALVFGARNRDNGLRGGAIDDIRIFTRALAALEVAQLHDGRAVDVLLSKSIRTEAEMAALRHHYFSAVDTGARELAARLRTARSALRETREGVGEISVMEETAAPVPAYVLTRGAFDNPGERVERATPPALPPMPEGAPLNRLGLAQWLTSPQHPLTARVLMNRLWQQLFGRGLVATSENFGLQGLLPSHPELLDWLARDFITTGWDFKRTCREIVLSATYRQDSRTDPELRARDPDNILLARGPSRRLTAEMLRDSALALGGILRPEIGGPPAKPYQPAGSMWKSLNNYLPEYKADTGAGLHRRSLYTFWRRTTPPPNMMALDAPTRDVCTARRQATNTPLQPLVLLNDPQFVEAARFLAARMLREGGDATDGQLTWLFREITGRAPSPAELPILQRLYTGQRAIFAQKPDRATALLSSGTLPSDSSLPAIDLAAATVTASAVFNLDASVMLR